MESFLTSFIGTAVAAVASWLATFWYYLEGSLASIIGTAVGGVVTWLVARRYYLRASQDLYVEAAELRRLTTLILQVLEHAGLVKVNWGPGGRPLGFNITLPVGTPGITFSAPAASIIVEPASDDDG